MSSSKASLEEGSTAEGLAFRGERLGKYEILSRLSVGGMAELFLAFTRGPGGFRKYVVLKRILPEVRSDDQFVKMFLDEARITAGLNHPNIGQVFDLGEEGEVLYLAMEFIAGRDLNQITSAQFKKKLLLPVGFSAAVCRDICNALHYAHTSVDASGKALSIIHRDVAQKNVMVTYTGVSKLLDFGIAKAKGSLGRTRVGMVKGTTGYMSPEQVQAQPLDGRSDVFSVGVMLYELTTGRRLFSGASEEEEMRKILSAAIPTPKSVGSHISDGLQDVILKALARNRDERFGSAREMSKALEGCMGKELFTQDQSAELMRALFSKKMASTQALIESAEEDGRREVPNRPVVRAVAEEEPKGSRTAGLGPKAGALDSTPLMLEAGGGREGSPPSSGSISRETDHVLTARKELRQRLLTGMLVAGVVVAALGVFFWRSSQVPPATRVRREKEPAAVPATAVVEPKQALKPEEPREAPVLPPPVAQPAVEAFGSLTLKSRPAAEVWFNHKLLGRTPLVEVNLPPGQQVLDLRGDDRVTRRLRVIIHPGQLTRSTVELKRLHAEK
jgi:serine/threonine-protein kinase